MYKLSDIREELRHLTLTGNICKSVWRAWKDACGIQDYARQCDHDQWVKLCACVALHRCGRPINETTVRFFLAVNSADPMAFLPGLLPIDQKVLPGTCAGAALPDVIHEITHHRPHESSVRRWVQAIGLEYSRHNTYSSEAIQKIISIYLKNRGDKVRHGRQLAATYNHRKRTHKAA